MFTAIFPVLITGPYIQQMLSKYLLNQRINLLRAGNLIYGSLNTFRKMLYIKIGCSKICVDIFF